MKIYDVAVIGGGSAGTMACQRVVLNNDECLFFPGSTEDKKRSRAFWVTKVENMPAHFQYKKGIDEPNKEVFDWLSSSEFKSKFHHFKNTGIVDIEKNEAGYFILTDSKGAHHHCKYVILCTGVMDVQPLINNSIDPIFPYANVQLADYCLRCDGHHVLNKKISVIGHTSGALWVAIMLYERYQCPEVNILTNGETTNFDEETTRLATKYNFKIHTAKIQNIDGDPKNKILSGFKLENGTTVSSEYVFISLGMIVYNELAKKLQANLDQRGFVIADNKGKSSVDGLFVAGDLRANTKKQIYTAWDTAVDAADEINVLIRREKRQAII